MQLLPGYVFIQTRDPGAVAARLAEVPAFTRLLGSNGEYFMPLSADEEAWLNAYTDIDTHVVEMSEGVIEGDRVMVMRGPLKGREFEIRRIDRHKREAELEVPMLGRVKRIRSGWRSSRSGRAWWRGPGWGRNSAMTIEHEEISGAVAADVHVPVSGTREHAERDAREDGRLSLLRKVRDWDGSRLGYRVVKRAFDIAFSAWRDRGGARALLRCCAWRSAWRTPGCPIYGQKRVGRIGPDGRPREFTMWKFRSMVKGADGMLDQLLERNEVEGPMFKMADDPRVTRIGRFIRRHSIDEFPQFVNVLLGQMSVVGPRPPLPREGWSSTTLGYAAACREAGPHRSPGRWEAAPTWTSTTW